MKYSGSFLTSFVSIKLSEKYEMLSLTNDMSSQVMPSDLYSVTLSDA